MTYIVSGGALNCTHSLTHSGGAGLPYTLVISEAILIHIQGGQNSKPLPNLRKILLNFY